ncbi:MAG: malectin domain-containing carbohydrate-binding protein [Mariniphaga sp.]
MKTLKAFCFAIVFLLVALAQSLNVFATENMARLVIVRKPESSPRVKLAATELRRYIYLRTGSLCKISDTAPTSSSQIIFNTDGSLTEEQFNIRTKTTGVRSIVTITGGSDLGILYGAYRYIEKLGARFYLHGDVIPDKRITSLPEVNEDGKPLFATRGILPFHDFFEGPDWWNTDDYKTYAVQMAKLRMNFIGLHNYPERQQGYPGPEPTVWIGLPEDNDSKGDVTFSYPAFFANTLRPGWGNIPMKTSDYVGGASELFEHDAYGPDPQIGYCPWPTEPSDCNTVFNRTAAMYREAFSLARGLGIKTCIGTETPLTIPESVKKRLISKGENPADSTVVSEIYQGMFQRITKAFPVDYYWLWTPEEWNGGNKPNQFATTATDIRAALGALTKLGNPLTLATCGWVLGPQNDRAALDNLLPKNSPMSCINQGVGHTPVESSFGRIQGRPKWAIPWFENDPNMTGPQPWVGRMIYDGADALRYGCTGLIGIHWRTKVIEMNIAALAQAGWSIPEGFQPIIKPVGAVKGDAVSLNVPISGTNEGQVYQTIRNNTEGYQLEIPNGTYTVTVKLVEPTFDAVGKRIFGINIQGKTIFDRVDIFEKAGKERALDLDANKVRVVDGRLNLQFIRITDSPCIAGITINGMTDAVNQIPGQPYTRKINCGGPTWNDFEADQVATVTGIQGEERSLGTSAFYDDWTEINFGPQAAPEISKLFKKLDGKAFPEISGWGAGPGRVTVKNKPWTEEAKRFTFVDEMEAIRPVVKGAGNLERFDYWLNTFRFTRAMAQFGCAVGEMSQVMKGPNVDKVRALTVRKELARLWVAMIRFQIAAVDTPGEMGTIANLEQQSRGTAQLLTRRDSALTKLLGTPLPPACQPLTTYEGPARIIVPTVRTQIAPNEKLSLKIILVGGTQPKTATLHWRTMGSGSFRRVPLEHIARSVYSVSLPAETNDFEYYIETGGTNGTKLMWPATAPQLNQTVIVADIANIPSE